MKKIGFFSILVPFLGAAVALQAANDPNTLIVTASNATANQLLVFNTAGKLMQTVSTQGKGGASGNAGGIEAHGGTVAVVNFGSQNVSIFERGNNGLQMRQLVPTVPNPVSVAFGAGHLYILGATKVESHRMDGLQRKFQSRWSGEPAVGGWVRSTGRGFAEPARHHGKGRNQHRRDRDGKACFPTER